TAHGWAAPPPTLRARHRADAGLCSEDRLQDQPRRSSHTRPATGRAPSGDAREHGTVAAPRYRCSRSGRWWSWQRARARGYGYSAAWAVRALPLDMERAAKPVRRAADGLVGGAGVRALCPGAVARAWIPGIVSDQVVFSSSLPQDRRSRSVAR